MKKRCSILPPSSNTEDKEPEFDYLPGIDGFVKSEKERRFSALTRATRSVGTLYVVSQATPEEQVQILRRSMKKTFQDLEFQTEFRKLAGETPSPLMPEAQEERTVPRDAESIGFNCLSLLTASPTETAPLHCIPMMRKCCIERLLRLSAVFAPALKKHR